VANAAGLPTNPLATTTVTLQQQADGTWQTVGVNCNAVGARPQVTLAMVIEQFRKLVPGPAVGIAPQGDTLVNIETVLWVNTAAELPLATTTLVGHRVDLRIDVDHVDWSFGDGSGATTDSPEPAYDDSDPCTTATCADYWGHTYTTAGTQQVSATVTWAGSFRVDGGAWQDIPVTVAGPAQTAAVTVHEARGVLVGTTRG
jgi:hypothetical protein